MPDVFASRCLPELLEVEVDAEGWEDEREEDEDMWAGGDEGCDEIEPEPDVTELVSEERDRIFLLLRERLFIFHDGAALRELPLADPSSLLYEEEIEGWGWEAVEGAIDQLRLLISELVVDTYLGETEDDDLPQDLVSEAMRSEGGVEALAATDTEFSTHDIVHGYLVARLVEYFEAVAGSQEVG